jgi:membrane associated rhomboid family serine protease
MTGANCVRYTGLRDDPRVVIPIHDRNPVHRTPVVTYLLIAANFAVFLLMPFLSGTATASGVEDLCRQEAFLREYAAIPRELVTNEPLPPSGVVADGRQVCPVIRVEDKVPFVSALTAMFLHAGWLHLLGNMLFLYVFGNNVEDRMGHIRFLLFYLVTGYAATYAFAFLNADSTATLVGASGAVSGVLGAYLWMFPRAVVIALVPFLFFLPFLFPAWLVLGMWIVLQFLYMQAAAIIGQASVAYAAHVAGFIAGFLIAAATAERRPPERVEPAWTRYHQR